MKVKKFVENILKTRLWIIILIFIVIFLSINITRVSTSSAFPGHDSTVFMNDFSSYESFNYEGFNLFYEIIIELSFIFNQTNAIMLVLLILGITNIILFDKVSKYMLRNNLDRTLAIVLFVLSNLFLYSIMGFTYLSALITISLWVILTTIKKPSMIFVPLVVSLLINFEFFIFSLILSTIFFVITKSKVRIYPILEEYKTNKYIKRIVFLPALVFIALYIYHSIIIKSIFITKINYSNTVLSTGPYVIPLVYIALAIFALFAEIKDKKLMILTLILMLIGWINIYFGLILLFAVTLMAAVGIRHIIQRKWFVRELRTPVIFLLMLLFLFMSLNFVQTTIDSGPSQVIITDIHIMNDFKVENMDNKIVFCEIRDCEIVKLYSNQSVYYSSLSYVNKKEHIEKLNITETIMQNSNLKVMEDFFEENNISTVFISKKVLNEKWTRSDQGILLLLTQSNRFVKVNDTTDSLVYYYNNETIL